MHKLYKFYKSRARDPPLRGNYIGKIRIFFFFGDRKTPPLNRSRSNLTLIGATSRPCGAKKPKNRPVSKRNTGRAALRADPAGNKKSEKHHISSSHANVRRAISTKFCMVIEVVRVIILGQNVFGSCP